MKNPKLSVVVPIYGVEKFIERCVESLFSQTLDNIQFVFVDDCSPDNSISILSSMINEYRQIIEENKWEVAIERTPYNSGLPKARRHGVKYATGDYIIHCDSDDWIDHNMLNLMYNKAITEEADVVVCDISMTDGANVLKVLKGCSLLERDSYISRMMLQKDHWSLCNKLFRRVYYKDVEYPDGGMGEDMALTLQLMLKCKKVAYVNDTSYYYYQNPESIVHVQSKESVLSKYKQLCKNSEIVNAVYSKNDDKEKFSKEIDWLWYRAANVLMPFINNEDVYEIWSKHFADRNISFLLNRKVSVLRKIRHILLKAKISYVLNKIAYENHSRSIL